MCRGQPITLHSIQRNSSWVQLSENFAIRVERRLRMWKSYLIVSNLSAAIKCYHSIFCLFFVQIRECVRRLMCQLCRRNRRRMCRVDDRRIRLNDVAAHMLFCRGLANLHDSPSNVNPLDLCAIVKREFGIGLALWHTWKWHTNTGKICFRVRPTKLSFSFFAADSAKFSFRHPMQRPHFQVNIFQSGFSVLLRWKRNNILVDGKWQSRIFPKTKHSTSAE